MKGPACRQAAAARSMTARRSSARRSTGSSRSASRQVPVIRTPESRPNHDSADERRVNSARATVISRNARPSAFQKVCRARCHRMSLDQSGQLERIHPGSWADTTILTPVPRCAGECRFVRVARVLDASRTRTCVARVLAAVAPASRRACNPRPGPVTPARVPARGCQRRPFSPDAGSRPKTGCRRLPTGLPAIPYPRGQPGMTHRDEQSMRRRIKSTHIE
jgi:hypothetical protein